MCLVNDARLRRGVAWKRKAGKRKAGQGKRDGSDIVKLGGPADV